MRPWSFASLRLILIHGEILLTFALIPVWYRFSYTPLLLPPLYVSRFLILLPMLWTIFWWLLTGLPGFGQLQRDPARRFFAFCLLALALWGFASTFWAFQRELHFEVGATAALQLGVVALFVLAVACAGPPRPYVITVLIVSLVWNSLIGGLQVAKQGPIGLTMIGEFPIFIEWSEVSIVQAGDVRWLRPYGLLSHPNALGGVLALGLLACGVWNISRRRELWLVGTLSGLFGLWVLGLTFSRSAWLGLAGGAMVMCLLGWRARLAINRRRVVITAGLVLITGVLFVALYAPFLVARTGLTEEPVEQRSVSDRLVFLDFARQAIEESPILGVGIGNFPWKASYYLTFTDFDLKGNNVHNIYLSAWAEMGTVGLLLYAGGLVSGLWAACRRLWRQPGSGRGRCAGGRGGPAAGRPAGLLPLRADPVPGGAVGPAGAGGPERSSGGRDRGQRRGLQQREFAAGPGGQDDIRAYPNALSQTPPEHAIGPGSAGIRVGAVAGLQRGRNGILLAGSLAQANLIDRSDGTGIRASDAFQGCLIGRGGCHEAIEAKRHILQGAWQQVQRKRLQADGDIEFGSAGDPQTIVGIRHAQTLPGDGSGRDIRSADVGAVFEDIDDQFQSLTGRKSCHRSGDWPH